MGHKKSRIFAFLRVQDGLFIHPVFNNDYLNIMHPPQALGTESQEESDDFPDRRVRDVCIVEKGVSVMNGEEQVHLPCLPKRM